SLRNAAISAATFVADWPPSMSIVSSIDTVPAYVRRPAAPSRYRPRMRLGQIGAWCAAFTVASADDARPAAAEIEALGYETLWYPEGLGTRESFTNAAVLLAATDRIRICSGIANIWARRGLDRQRRPCPGRRLRRPVPPGPRRQPSAAGRPPRSPVPTTRGDDARLPRGDGRRPVRQSRRHGRDA